MNQKFDPTSDAAPDRRALNRANAARTLRQDGIETIDEERMAGLLADLQGAGYIRGDLGVNLAREQDRERVAKAAIEILRG